jgi:nitrate reductase alpha subunit
MLTLKYGKQLSQVSFLRESTVVVSTVVVSTVVVSTVVVSTVVVSTVVVSTTSMVSTLPVSTSEISTWVMSRSESAVLVVCSSFHSTQWLRSLSHVPQYVVGRGGEHFLRTTMSLPAASDIIELAGIGAAMHLDMAMARREIWKESLNCMFAVVCVGFGGALGGWWWCCCVCPSL